MNRRSLVLAGLAAVSSPALSLPASAQPRRSTRRRQASARPPARRREGGLSASHLRAQVITRTFTNFTPLTIPAGAPGITEGPAFPYPSTIPVNGLSQGRILKVVVRLKGLSHTLPTDLDILLVAPGNFGVMIMSDAGETAVNNITLTFDQNAPTNLPDNLASGVFQPSNYDTGADPLPPPAPAGVSGHSLTRLRNRNPNGPWRLFVFDDTIGNVGSLAGWSLTIRARVRVPRQQSGQHRQRRPQPAPRRSKR